MGGEDHIDAVGGAGALAVFGPFLSQVKSAGSVNPEFFWIGHGEPKGLRILEGNYQREGNTLKRGLCDYPATVLRHLPNNDRNLE